MFQNYNFKDSRDINRLARELRKKNQSERDNSLRSLLNSDYYAQKALLTLIKRVSPSKIFLEEVLYYGIDNSDVSSISQWLKNTAPVYGLAKLMQLLSKKYANKPESIILCLYQLVFLINRKSQKEIDAYRNLVKISMNIKPESYYYNYFKMYIEWLNKSAPKLLPK